jgi:hypothetical protein
MATHNYGGEYNTAAAWLLPFLKMTQAMEHSSTFIPSSAVSISSYQIQSTNVFPFFYDHVLLSLPPLLFLPRLRSWMLKQ